ncbi:unnamed protein product [Ranitomeya imitator]|uniref:Uncharacterized protein n=1 Tax=Ranitomeya imitator TaxID=111125 RepID=A0ABN9MMF9_9NEOB|nr:unnamed protein product [Ranitomeya imitator]
MSFSATILFTPPPGQSDGKCACKVESTSGGSVSVDGATPITVNGQGMAVQGCEQLLHLIYQRVEKAVGLAEAALNVANANSSLLSQLQGEVSSLRREMERPEAPKSPPEIHARCKLSEEEAEEIGGVQVVIEELRQLGAASASLVTGLHPPVLDRTRENCLTACPPNEAPSLLSPVHMPVIDDFLTSESPAQRILASTFVKQLTDTRPHRDPAENLNEPIPPIVKSSHSQMLMQKDGSLSPGGMIIAETSPDSGDMRPSSSPCFPTFYSGSNSRQRSNGQKCSRRKRDLVLSEAFWRHNRPAHSNSVNPGVPGYLRTPSPAVAHTYLRILKPSLTLLRSIFQAVQWTPNRLPLLLQTPAVASGSQEAPSEPSIIGRKRSRQERRSESSSRSISPRGPSLRSASPRSSFSESGEAFSDAPSEDISELDPNQISSMRDMVQNLIGEINQTWGIKESSTEPADQVVSFRRSKPPSKFFAPHPEFKEIMTRERENPTRRFQRGKRLGVLYPFSPELTANWTVSPSVDPPVFRLSTNTVLPLSGGASLKDSDDSHRILCEVSL